MKNIALIVCLLLSSLGFSQTKKSNAKEIKMKKSALVEIKNVKELTEGLPAGATVSNFEITGKAIGDKLLQTSGTGEEITETTKDFLKNILPKTKMYVDVKYKAADGKVLSGTYVVRVE
jgi:hypothetical protein